MYTLTFNQLFQGGRGGRAFAPPSLALACSPAPWICCEFYFTCKSIQAFINDQNQISQGSMASAAERLVDHVLIKQNTI